MNSINATTPQSSYRILSIDLLRGIAMIVMALDHVRDYFHWSAEMYNPTDLSRTSIAIFFTRWITHFCAPVFVLLAGTSAYLVGARKGKKYLSGFLFKRGLWLIFLELSIISFGWFFDVHFSIFVLQTIWALGAGMIALAGIIHLNKALILTIAGLIIFAHNLLDPVHVAGQNAEAIGWALLHDQKFFDFHSFKLLAGYPVIPWIGLMTGGYCLGEIFLISDLQKRKKILFYLGGSAIILFLIVRFINIYGDPRPWSTQPSGTFTFLSFLNTTKYPPSLLYILMTMGPALIFLALTEKPLNKLTEIISVYGRVPLFYYVLHIYLIHLCAMLAAQLTGYGWKNMILKNFPGNVPSLRRYGFPLWEVYLVWLVLVIALYPLCKWYDNYKAGNRQKWWLSYL